MRISGDYDGNKHIISELTAVRGILIHENARWKCDYDGYKHIISKPIVSVSRECTFELWLLMDTNIIIKPTTVWGIPVHECAFKVWLMETKTSLVSQLWLAVFTFAWMHVWSVTLMETKMSLVYWPRSRGFKFTWMQIQSVTMMETTKLETDCGNWHGVFKLTWMHVRVVTLMETNTSLVNWPRPMGFKFMWTQVQNVTIMETNTSFWNWSFQLARGIQVHINVRSTCDFKRNKHINS